MKSASLRRCILNAYKKELTKTARWVKSYGFELKTYEDAKDDDICIVSKCDYELEETKSNIADDNGSFFLTQEEYERLFT